MKEKITYTSFDVSPSDGVSNIGFAALYIHRGEEQKGVHCYTVNTKERAERVMNLFLAIVGSMDTSFIK